MPRRAAFLDRDGTIIRDVHYPGDPEQVELLPGAAAAIRRLRDAGFLVVVVTNQSGIARGMYTHDDFLRVQARLDALLADAGARLDAVYHCPHHPDFSGSCDCRKPGLALYRRAAADLDIDLARSAYIGDRVHDVLPATRTGGRGVLVRTGYGAEEAAHVPGGIEVVADLDEAASSLTTGVDTPAGGE
jgi:D-glycero-D-manno-heptose 1,7-bisphosphate phosphatase